MPTYINKIWKSGPQRTGVTGMSTLSSTPVDSSQSVLAAEEIHDFAQGTDLQPEKMRTTPGIHETSQLNSTETTTAVTAAMKKKYYSKDEAFFEAVFTDAAFSYDAMVAAAKATYNPPKTNINKVLYKVKCGPFKAGNKEIALRELSMPANKLGLAIERNVEVMSMSAKETGDRLLSLFDNSDISVGAVGTAVQAAKPANADHVYLIFDTGTKLLSDVHGVLGSVTNSLTLHNIHSILTYSDSAKKSVAGTNPKYAYTKTKADGTTLKSLDWLCQSDILKTIHQNNAVFLSKYKITLKPAPAHIYQQHVEQKWQLCKPNCAAESTPNVWNSHTINNKTTIKAEVNKAKNKNAVNYATQRKRSGDHLQIYAAYIHPQLAINQANFTHKPSSSQKNAPLEQWHIPPGIPNQKYKWFKDRTYFVTGDKPAAIYSVACGVNTILYNTSSRVITRWKF